MTRPLTVVKIGGSLLGSERLARGLAALAVGPRDRLVVVPGGGPFADAVRLAQAQAGFDDTLAHRLALDAMRHMAEVLAALAPALRIARDAAEIAATWAADRIPVWDPAALRDGHPDIPESWSVTSDSLALWLATMLGADRLVLVKSIEAPPAAGWDELAAGGLVDAAFPAFARRYPGAIAWCGPGAGSDFRLRGAALEAAPS